MGHFFHLPMKNRISAVHPVAALLLVLAGHMTMSGAPADSEFVAVPLRAELVIESPQTLEPKFTGKAFRKRVAAHESREGKLEPLPVQVILRLTNTGTEPVEIRKGSDAAQLDLRLEGPGLVAVVPRVAMTREFRLGKPEVIPPGESRDLVFPFLGSGLRGMGTWHYWTEPGTVSILATYTGQLKDQRRFRVSAPAVPVEVRGEAIGDFD
jgi:hypothetical protein